MVNTIQMIPCKLCDREVEVRYDIHDWHDWVDGKLIQDAMPYLSSDEREMLQTQICDLCWNKIFPEEE